MALLYSPDLHVAKLSQFLPAVWSVGYRVTPAITGSSVQAFAPNKVTRRVYMAF